MNSYLESCLDTDDVSTCFPSGLLFPQFGIPTLDCNEFVRVSDCEMNDDLLPELSPKNGGCTDPDVVPTML